MRRVERTSGLFWSRGSGPAVGRDGADTVAERVGRAEHQREEEGDTTST